MYFSGQKCIHNNNNINNNNNNDNTNEPKNRQTTYTIKSSHLNYLIYKNKT